METPNDDSSDKDTRKDEENQKGANGRSHEDLFDSLEGKHRKEEGVSLASNNRKAILQQARKCAKLIAISRPSRTVTADDVQKALLAAGRTPGELGNAAGGIFRGKMWEYAGVEKSARSTNNSRRICVWKYIPENDPEFGQQTLL